MIWLDDLFTLLWGCGVLFGLIAAIWYFVDDIEDEGDAWWGW